MQIIFLTAQEIAKILKISKSLSYRLIADKKITSIRIGKSVRVREEDLQKFIERNSETCQSEETDKFSVHDLVQSK